MKHIILIALALLPTVHFGQFCDSFELTVEDELELNCFNNTVTTLHDQLGRDYLYAAVTQAGIKVIDLSDPTNMETVGGLPGSSFADLAVTRIHQEGNYLFVTIGSMFGAHSEPSGLAIVDVTDPLDPQVKDVWTSAEAGGAADVRIRGDLAYLCGLGNGLIVLNIADKENIVFVSQIIPEIGWPEGTDSNMMKARNIVFDGDIAYLAYGGGGIRILDISDPTDIEEVGRYSNPAMDETVRAYNNMILKENLLYVAADYAGLEVIDVTDIDDLTLHGWWNPNGFPLATPMITADRWFSSPWHTNEIELIEECGIVFMSCGRTEIVGVDITNPAEPMLCGSFGDSTDNFSSYGMTRYEDRLYVGLICTFGIPYPGEWSGVKTLVYDSDCPLSVPEETESNWNIYPNPTQDLVYFEGLQIQHAEVYSIQGQILMLHENLNQEINSLSLHGLPTGLYLIKLTDFQGKVYTKKISLL